MQLTTKLGISSKHFANLKLVGLHCVTACSKAFKILEQIKLLNN